MIELSKRLEGVSESSTLSFNARVQQMMHQGSDVMNLTLGEPDFFVHPQVKQAVLEAVRQNQSHYTASAGIQIFREAIAHYMNRQHGNSYWNSSHIVVTNGVKQALFNGLMAILNSGDEVLVPTPCWVSYPEMVKIAGGVVKFLPTFFENNFKIQPDLLKNALGPRVRAVILNSPCNPTGALYSQAEWIALGQVLLKHAPKIIVFSDEIYDRILVDHQPFCSFLKAVPELRHQTITFNGLSKSAAMTGWRVGWSVASEPITQAMTILQAQSTSGVNSLAQWAGLAALKLPEEVFVEQQNRYRARYQLMLESFGVSHRMQFCCPQGAFYLFINMKNYLKQGETTVSLIEKLLEKAGVAGLPGEFFGEPGFMRLSFAAPEASLQEGCKRLIRFLGQIE